MPSSLVLGSALHEALATYHLAIKQSEEVGLIELEQTLLKRWERVEAKTKVDYKPSETRSDLTELAIELLKLYLLESPPTNILHVEQHFLTPIQNSRGDYLETPLLAVADLVVADAGQLKICEFKTSARAYGHFDVENSMQATCYVTAIWECLAKWADVEFTVFVKTRSPKIQRVSTRRRNQDFQRLGDVVEAVELAIANNAFYPIESAMNCSTCSFRSQCRQWTRCDLDSAEFREGTLQVH